MTQADKKLDRVKRHWLDEKAGSFEAFKGEVAQSAQLEDWPFAAGAEKNVLIYEGDDVRKAVSNPEERRALMAEWVAALSEGPGVLAIQGAYTDHAAIDQASDVFDQIIKREKAQALGSGDHFAKAGANDRIWNSLEKHCLADPANFAAYYSNQAIALVSEAWLGIGYQMTGQVNRVNPGGAAQTPHRDYHLGFMKPAQMTAYPAHIHRISPVLTLQGAVAHCDMPIETGPTQLLPFSQNFFEGYIAFSRAEFQDYFQQNFVQVPLSKGDALFFNPALMHGAGANQTADIQRMANLLQVSSGFGRAMESVDRVGMTKALYPALLAAQKNGSLNEAEIHAAIAASAEGYAFPTNLDRDPPIGGLAPKTQAVLTQEALAAGSSASEFDALMDAAAARRLS